MPLSPMSVVSFADEVPGNSRTSSDSSSHDIGGHGISEFGAVAALGIKNRRPSVLNVRAKREARKALNAFVEGCVGAIEAACLDLYLVLVLLFLFLSPVAIS